MNGKTEKLTVLQRAQLTSGKTFWQTHGFEEAGVESLFFSDGPAGLRTQSGKGDSLGLNSSAPSTCFPAHSALACSFNAELVKKVGFSIGAEAAKAGVDVLLAPAINIKRNPLNGRNFEYFSEDPFLSGVMGREYISGVQESGVGACVKHFAANNREFGRTVCDSAVDTRTLREIYLTPFEIAVKGAKPAAVMTAYNRLNGVYCNENKRLITEMLRGEWGHDGIVVSDWGGTNDRVAAIKAGADLEMPCCKFSADEIMQALEMGELQEEELNACADRIVCLSERLKSGERHGDIAGEDFAEKCAEECAVLLKNDGVLPLKGGEKLALIGDLAENPAYQGGGSSHVNPTCLTRLTDCMSVLGFERGYKANGKKSKRLIRRALKLAARADVIICVVGLSAGDAEGVDRENIRLPENQTELLSALKGTGKRVVAVLSCGGAVETDWDDGVNALLFAGLNGQSGAAAVKKILTGEANPSGKLAETFPEKLEDLPSVGYFKGNAYGTEYKEGMRVGYRGTGAAKYPFGFGLSYTAFDYSDIKTDGSGAEFTLKNAGDYDGAEAVQLYIGYPESANELPVQLKGFKKVYLRAGESARIRIPFDEYSFRSFDTKSGRWVTVGGRYKIYIGASSQDLRLLSDMEIEGTEGVPAADCTKVRAEEYPITLNKKGRVIADFRTPFSELKNSRGALSRLAVKFALAVAGRSPTAGGTMRYVTLRTAAQFARFDGVRASGLVDFFGGKYFKGIRKIIRGKKKSDKK